MNHSQIFIGSTSTPTFLFDDSTLIRLNSVLSVDVIGSELNVDELYATVRSNNKAGIVALDYGTPVWFYYDGALAGKFYLKQAKRTGPKEFELTCQSAVGLLNNLKDYGGIFTASGGDTFKAVLAGILGGSVGALQNGQYPITGGVFDCFVEQQVGDLIIDGHLPIGTKRENLHDLMIAEGVALKKSSDGTPVFSALYNQDSPTSIADSRIYIGGKIKYKDAVTAVNLTEYTFLPPSASDELVTLFDGSAAGTADHALIEFADPCHTLTPTNLTVHESNPNYAIVSGAGTLTGRKYTVSEQVLRKSAQTITGEPNEMFVRGIRLINTLNSASVLERLFDYYSASEQVEMDVVVQNGEPKCGNEYAFNDPFNEATTGYVSGLELVPSGIMKASCKIVTNYTPKSSGNSYSNATLYTSGDITVPVGVTKMRLILIAGGTGGSAGSDGAAGNLVTVTQDPQFETQYLVPDPSTATGGSGGAGGPSGSAAGKVLTVELDPVTPGDVITVMYGTGGAAGQTGTDTTITVNGVTYSTANGSVPSGGIVNLFTGDVYAKPGEAGEAGANGGNFETAGDNSNTGTGGKAGIRRNRYAMYDTYQWAGGGGGGAANNANGADGTPLTGGSAYYTGPVDGGKGADASVPAQADYGCGGRGGNGGGGGGGAGYSLHFYTNQYGAHQACASGSGGLGGAGSAGGQGGDGCVLAYY